jgi:hypothetical protein
MPRLIDRRSGDYLGSFSTSECAQLRALLETPSTSEEPFEIDPQVVERFAEAGASERVLTVLQQVLQDRGDFALDWEADAE